MNRFIHWWRHLGKRHTREDLGPIYKVGWMKRGTKVVFRRCKTCGRSFVEFE